ncbi:MAG: HAD family phosphatase [Bdellovibrionota bacterium]
MPVLRAVIFDFDGVLADTEKLHWELYQEVLSPLGASFSWDEYVSRWMALHDEGCIEAVLIDRKLPAEKGKVSALAAQKGKLFQERLGRGRVDLFPGVASLVGRLAAKMPIAIASGALRIEVEAVLRAHGLLPSFSAVVAAEDCEHHKPHPEPYERALAALNRRQGAAGISPRETLVFEDTPDGIRSAKRAGMWCVGITNSYPAEKLEAADLAVEGLEGIELLGLEARLESGAALGAK